MSFALPERTSLPDDVEQLKDLVLQTICRANVAVQDAGEHIERLALQLVMLRRKVFGVRSEKSPGQVDLFDGTVALPIPMQSKERITYERKRRGRPSLPADLPRVRIEYELDAVERAQFVTVEPIGEETSETLEFTPARLVVI